MAAPDHDELPRVVQTRVRQQAQGRRMRLQLVSQRRIHVDGAAASRQEVGGRRRQRRGCRILGGGGPGTDGPRGGGDEDGAAHSGGSRGGELVPDAPATKADAMGTERIGREGVITASSERRERGDEIEPIWIVLGLN
jgi:hypothetical protein